MLTGKGEGVGLEPNHTTARKPVPLQNHSKVLSSENFGINGAIFLSSSIADVF
jgi:hypothetical protein